MSNTLSMHNKFRPLKTRHRPLGATRPPQRPSGPKTEEPIAILSEITRVMDLGAAILPLVEGGKAPAKVGSYKTASKDGKTIDAYFRAHPKSNYGIATGARSGFLALDIDGPEGIQNLNALTRKNGSLPLTSRVKTPHGEHRYFEMPDHLIANSVGRIAPGIDVRGEGGYVVGPGSKTPEGVYRFFPGRGPGEVKIATAPGWLLRLIGKKPNPIVAVGVRKNVLSSEDRDRAVRYAQAALEGELGRLRKAPVHQRNDTLNHCAYKLGRYVPGGFLDAAAVSRQLADVAKAIGLEPAEIGATIASGLRGGMRNTVRLPFEKGSAPLAAKMPGDSDEQLAKELAHLGETDVDNVERFVRRFGRKVIYSNAKGFMIFDGKRYRPNALLQCVALGTEVVSKIQDEIPYVEIEGMRAQRARFAQQSKSKGTIDRMLDLAKVCLLVEEASLDADPYLLNTETCTINLRTGQFNPHDPRDLLTKMAPVAASANATCPTFDKFIDRITECDEELAVFIQKAVGLSLTGDITEQVLFFVYGKLGSNGKSTLINLIRELLGDYGCHTPTETLLSKQYDNAIPADLARLAGARMVTAIESNFNRQLDEAKVKAMTGGEPITARHLYQNYFEFKPEFKLWLVANDPPRVRATDDAMWRRIRVIPMNAKIPPDEIDAKLPAKLRAEWPGILCWAVRGCLKWQREGLEEPEAVKEASRKWREDVDHIRRFVQETLIVDSNLQNVMPASELISHFTQWCTRNGETPISAARLKAKLQQNYNLTHKHTKNGSVWCGVRLKR